MKKCDSITLVKKCIVDALTQLMQEKDFDKISVTELCDRAGVSRMTYYRYFETKNDVIKEHLKYIAQKFQKDFQNWKEKNTTNGKVLIQFIFAYFKKYSGFINAIRKANLTEYVLKFFNTYLENVTKAVKKDTGYIYKIYGFAGALYNIYMKWLDNGMKESVREMADNFYRTNRFLLDV